jgi:periplasmic copper chaperone A
MKNLLKAVPLMVLPVAGLCGAASAQPKPAAAPQAMVITDAWFRSLPGKLPAGGYFSAHNSGRSDLAITGAKSNACGMLMLHQSQDKGGMSSMNMLDKVEVPGGQTVAFTPGSFHLMCEEPKLKIGTPVSVVLSLSDGTSVAVRFAVRNAKGK